MKIKFLFKKLLKFCIIATIIISSKLLPMNMHMDNIDLKINQKPANISVYDWSKRKAEELVREKRLNILRLLGRTEEGWQETKENLEPIYKRGVDNHEGKYRKQILPQSAHELIIRIIEHPLVQKELGITGISIKDGIIVAERAYAYPIKFLCEDPDETINSPEGSDGYNIIISPRIAFNGNYTNEALEAFIGHELAHIKCKHSTEKYCFINLYQEKLARHETNIDKATFDAAILELDRAIEVQADIVGTFNNWIWLETIKNYWRDETNEFESYGGDSNSFESDMQHPPLAVRANYCYQMYSAIQKESEPKISISVRPAPTKPANIIPEPARPNLEKHTIKQNVTKNETESKSDLEQKIAKEIQNKNTCNTQKKHPVLIFFENLINKTTPKQALWSLGVFMFICIILKK